MLEQNMLQVFTEKKQKVEKKKFGINHRKIKLN